MIFLCEFFLRPLLHFLTWTEVVICVAGLSRSLRRASLLYQPPFTLRRRQSKPIHQYHLPGAWPWRAVTLWLHLDNGDPSLAFLPEPFAKIPNLTIMAPQQGPLDTLNLKHFVTLRTLVVAANKDRPPVQIRKLLLPDHMATLAFIRVLPGAWLVRLKGHSLKRLYLMPISPLTALLYCSSSLLSSLTHWLSKHQKRIEGLLA